MSSSCESNDDSDEPTHKSFVGRISKLHNGVEPSPRPTKRRRMSRMQVEGDDSDEETTDTSRNGVGTAASTHNSHKRARAIASEDHRKSYLEPETDEEYYFPEELPGGQERLAKTTKHKIHIPKDPSFLEKLVFTQTQADLDSDPSHFRGPVWKKPVQPSISLRAASGVVSGSKDGLPCLPDDGSGRSAALVNADSRDSRLGADHGSVASLSKHTGTNIQSLNGSTAPFQRGAEATRTKPADVFAELADLPSDAFSSSTNASPVKDVVVISSGISQPQGQLNERSRPLTELRQTTIYGHLATQDGSATQKQQKSQAWPMMSRSEAPTHHTLDKESLKTWIYPTNLGDIRDYQFNIVARSLFHNILVALPTGLGKTFIAATLMLNYYRWTTHAQIVFMAPTKPLIAQQMEACLNIVGISRRDTVLMTGETAPALRAEEWQEKRVFFMTPQTVINDLKTGICDPKRIVLLVVDEAHKASGGYAYTEVVAFVRRFNNSFRVQALTATPGSTVEAVQGVIDSLGIARVELRTESSLDIRKYTHEKRTETEVFEWSDEQELIMEHLTKALQPSVDKLRTQNAYWSRDPMQLNAFALTQARQKWMASDAGRKASVGLKGMVNSLFAILSSLAHSISLLKFHGIGPFYSGMLTFQREVESGQKKGKAAKEIAESESFTGMMRMLRGWTNNPDFVGHPKLQYLREVVLNHFLDAGEGTTSRDAGRPATKVMVFASFRDSTEEICRVLKRNEPMIRPHVFVGQAASKGSEGMDQKKQNQVIQDFKSGKYNTLVATSIGEEGLDIGDVDLIVCYDASSSPIRMLQRIGRTGRKRIGRVVLLLMKQKEEGDYAKAQDSYLWIQKSIADSSKYTFHEDLSPRILPKDAQPIVDKRVIEIPVENSQPLDLNEKNRRSRRKCKVIKRPPKKFHMPDGVRTGFVKASRMESSDSSNEDKVPVERKTKSKKVLRPKKVSAELKPEPEIVQLPFFEDVVLSRIQEKELERKYAQTARNQGDSDVRAPYPAQHPEHMRDLGASGNIAHGRTARAVAKALQAMKCIDDDRIARMKSIMDRSDLEDYGSAEVRLAGSEQVLGLQSATPRSYGLVEQCQVLPKRQHTEPEKPTIRNAAEKSNARRTTKQPQIKKAADHHETRSDALEAVDGQESSPEPTPANMRIGTQGIDLGLEDTSGEEDEDEHDSDLDDFVVGTDATIDMLSSSQWLPDDTQLPGQKRTGKLKPSKRPKPLRKISSSSPPEGVVDILDDLPLIIEHERNDDNDIEEVDIPITVDFARDRKRKVIDSSDTDE